MYREFWKPGSCSPTDWPRPGDPYPSTKSEGRSSDSPHHRLKKLVVPNLTYKRPTHPNAGVGPNWLAERAAAPPRQKWSAGKFSCSRGERITESPEGTCWQRFAKLTSWRFPGSTSFVLILLSPKRPYFSVLFPTGKTGAEKKLLEINSQERPWC